MRHNNQRQRVLMLASVASMIDQFNLPNIQLLLKMGYEVHVACNFKEGNTCDEKQILRLKKQLCHMQVSWHQWDCPRSIRSIKKCCTAYRQLWKLTGRYSYAWIHCHSPVGGALARVAAHWRGIRVIYTAHGFHFYKGAPLKNWLLYYPVEKLLSCWTDVLITVNKEDHVFAKKNFHAGKICYIPGIGIDAGAYKKTCTGGSCTGFRETYHIPQNAVLLLSVGELSKRKNHRTAIIALSKLHRKDVFYLVCGQGKWKKRLVRCAEKYGVLEYMRMPGFLENVKEAYEEADIFVFPSNQEGLPVALMEAMASGLPCVVSNIRGNRELIGNARLRFRPDDSGQLKEILLRLLDDKKQREVYGACNRKKIAGYDLASVQRRMECIYNEKEKGARDQ